MESAPEIAHVEANVSALSDILARYTQHSFHELKTLIQTLQSKSKSDNAKKKAFLDLVVAIRQNFVRLYVLCKWARASKDIGKLIDVFVWLRTQNQTFADAIYEVTTIKASLMSAKLPDPDLTTAIEVLLKGRPQLPTHGLLPKKPLSPQLLLRTLKSLNVSLSTRMALEENLPPAFQDYVVKDGRVVFTVPKSFRTSIAIADDTVDNAPFFLVNFEFCFASQDGCLVESLTPLPVATHARIEKLANATLANDGLTGLYSVLHRFSTTFKLYLLHRQLLSMRIGLWKGNLSHTYNAEKCFVVITYWAKKTGKLRSTIEIGVDKQTQDLSFRWVRDGQLVKDHDVQLDESSDEMINLEKLIRRITKRHSELLIQRIHDDICAKIEDAEKIVSVEGGSIVLDLDGTKTAVFSLDSLSGKGYFINPTPLMSQSATSINAGEFNDTSTKLLKLRLDHQKQNLASMLLATGWINVDVVKLPSAEIAKLNIDHKELKDAHLLSQLYTITFYRRREWTAGWFLCAGISGFSKQVDWWCARIKSSLGQWSINWSESLRCTPGQNSTHRLGQSYDYSSLLELSKISAAKLLCHLTEEELTEKGAKIVTLDSHHPKVEKFFSNHKITKYLPEGLPTTEEDELPVMFLENDSFGQDPECWGDLVLLVKMSAATGTMEMILIGELKQSFQTPDAKSSDDIFKQKFSETTTLEVDQKEFIFSVTSKVDVEDRKTTTLTEELLTVLSKLTLLITLLKLVGSDQSIKILDISLNEVSFQYGRDATESISLVLNEKQRDSKVLFAMPNTNPHYLSKDYLHIMLTESLETPQFTIPKIYGPNAGPSTQISGVISPTALNGFITYLKLTLPLSRAAQEITAKKKEYQKLFTKKALLTDDNSYPPTINGIPCLMHEVFCYGSSRYKFEYIITRKSEDQKKSNKVDRVKVSIDVDMRNRGSFFGFSKTMFYISCSDLTLAPDLINALFSGDEIYKHGAGKAVPLQKGLAVDYQAVHPLLLRIHDAFFEKYSKDT